MSPTQADKLRMMAASRPGKTDEIPSARRNIVIASGKGGVGKTTIAVNLAIAITDLGLECGLVDADLGLADAHVLMGYKPSANISDLLKADVNPQTVLNRVPNGPWLLPGSNGDPAMASLPSTDRKRLIDSISNIAHPLDILLFDASAGVGPEITDFAIWANEVILVVVPEATSILDAYGFLKIYKKLGGAGPVWVLVNRVPQGESHVSVYGAIATTARGFLDMEIRDLGGIPEDPHASRALSQRKPLLRSFPLSPMSKAIASTAKRLCGPSKQSLTYKHLL